MFTPPTEVEAVLAPFATLYHNRSSKGRSRLRRDFHFAGRPGEAFPAAGPRQKYEKQDRDGSEENLFWHVSTDERPGARMVAAKLHRASSSAHLEASAVTVANPGRS